MTVTYTGQVATCKGFGCFLKLLFRWRGSIYKLVWLDLVVFLLVYYILNIWYRVLMLDGQKRIFEGIVKYCATYTNLIPLSFVLGFYVSIVMTRWWGQYTSIPWPDPIAVFVSANVHGQDERARLMRRTIMRYVCLCLTMVFVNISPRVKKRFPTLDQLVEAGLLLENEKIIMSNLNSKFPRHSKHWMPIIWAASIVTRARREDRIRDDFAVKTVIDELNKFRGQCGLLISYDTISVPLVYTQVVTLAVYSFFIASAISSQWFENKPLENDYVNVVDLYFPIFATLQFFFYMGWLKVAESLINPFGEDDDDFEVNWMVDRNLQVSYMIVDEMHHEHPELIRDQYWDEVFPAELPYSVASEPFRETHPEPSTAAINVKTADAEMIPIVPSSVKVDDMVGKSLQTVNYTFPQPDQPDSEMFDDNASGIHFTTGHRHQRLGSGNSLSSIAGSMRRVNTASSFFKRLLSRSDSQTPTPQAVNDAAQLGTSANSHTGKMSKSASNTSLAGSKNILIPGTVRITDQVIEEVDEQMTITSMRQPEIRPKAEDLFNQGPLMSNPSRPPPPSKPVDVPMRNLAGSSTAYGTHSTVGHHMPPKYSDNSEFVSCSAPTVNFRPPTPPGFDEYERDKARSKESGISGQVPIAHIADVMDGEESIDDEFEKLRIARERERLERQKQNIARSISTTTAQGGITANLSNLNVDLVDTLASSITDDLNLQQ